MDNDEITLKILTLVPPDKSIKERDILAADTRITRKMLSYISFCEPASRLLHGETETVDDEETGIPTSLYFTYRRTPAGSDWIRNYNYQKEHLDSIDKNNKANVWRDNMRIARLAVAILAILLGLVYFFFR